MCGRGTKGTQSHATRRAIWCLVLLGWLIGITPARSDVITDYYYTGTQMSGVVAWDSTIDIAQLTLYGGGYTFTNTSAGVFTFDSSGQVASWGMTASTSDGLGTAQFCGDTRTPGACLGRIYGSGYVEGYQYGSPATAVYVNYNASGSWSTTPPTSPGPGAPVPPTPLFTAREKMLAGQAAAYTDVASAAVGFEAFLVAVTDDNNLGALLSILTTVLGNATVTQTADAEAFFAECEALLGKAGKGSGTAVCGLAAAAVALDLVRQVLLAVKADPPDPDFQDVFVPTIEPMPVGLGGACSGLGTASASLPYALDVTDEWLNALYVTNNRYQTALEVGNNVAAALQDKTFRSYLGSYSSAAHVASTNLECFSNLLAVAGLNQLPTQPDQVDALSLLSAATPDDIASLGDVFSTLDLDPMALIATAEAAPAGFPTDAPVVALNNVAGSLGFAAVPEPSSLIILLTGIPGLVLFLKIEPMKRLRALCLSPHQRRREALTIFG